MNVKTGSIQSSRVGYGRSSEKQNPILPTLKHALGAAGDFPIREKIVNELREVARKPDVTVEEITSMILAEPTLGARIVHLVNSAYCNSASEILTVSQAVVQVGMRNLVDLCAGLIRVQSLVHGKRKGDFFQKHIAHSTLTSTLARELFTRIDKKHTEESEQAFLAGTFYSLGHLLISFYFPQIYSAANQRAQNRGSSIEKSLSELLGLDRSGLNLAIADGLQIPAFYRAILIETKPDQKLAASPLARVLTVANQLATVLLNSSSSTDIEEAILKLSAGNQLFTEQVIRASVIGGFKQYNQCLELSQLKELSAPPSVYDFVSDSKNVESQENNDEDIGQDFATEEFKEYVEEIKESIEAKEPVSSIVASVMESIAFGLGFDRVLLLLINGPKTALVGRMSLGNIVNFDPKSIARAISDPELEDSIDVQCFLTGNLTSEGIPLLTDSSCYVAVPICRF